VREEEKILDDFARKKFQEFVKEKNPNNVWYEFSSYEIESINKIIIHYEYGYGDMEYKGKFDIIID